MSLISSSSYHSTPTTPRKAKNVQETEDHDVPMTTLSGQRRYSLGNERKTTGQVLHSAKDKEVVENAFGLNQTATNTVYTTNKKRRSAEIDNANITNTDGDDDVKRRDGEGHLYTAPLSWTRQNVQSWFQTTRLKQLAPKFSALDGLHLLALSVDETKLKTTVANSLLVGAMEKALMTIRREYRIEEKDIRSKLKELRPRRTHTANPKRHSCYSGVIALRNQGNTCYMNSCLQALLQAPVLVPFLRAYKPGQNLYVNLKYRWSLLDAMSDIARSAARGERSFTPSQISSILSGINPRFGSGDQDDSSLVMSTILHELDQLCNLDAGVSADAGADNCPIYFDAEPSPDDEETLVNDRVLDSHNPNNSSIIRATMDGVLKTISYCFECNFKRVQYETFRILQLPLINNIAKLNVAICFVGDPQIHHRTYEVLGYCSLITLKAQIAASYLDSIAEDAASNSANESLPVSRVMASMYVCSVRPPPPGSHKPPTGAVDDWLMIYKNADKCNSLSSEVYAVVDLAAVVSPANALIALIALFEVVLNPKGKPKSKKQTNAVKFVAMTSSDRQCPITSSELIARCKHESRVADHNQRHLDVLLNNKLASEAEFIKDESFDFSTSTRASCARGGIVCVVLVWQAKGKGNANANVKNASTNTNAMPVANSTIDDGIYETAVCDNRGMAGDLAGIVHKLELRWRCVTGQMKHPFKYSDAYINKVTNTYNVLNSKMRQLNRVKKALSQQLNKIDRIRRQQSLRSAQAQHKPLSDIRDSLALLEKKIFLDNSKATFSCKCPAGCSSAFSEQRRLVHTPINLMLVIDRFGSASRSGKFTHLVHYPVDGKLVVGKQLRHEFELFATCDHYSESMKYGHYSANVRSLNTGDWYHTSDSNVHRSKVTESRNSIVLLYTKKK